MVAKRKKGRPALSDLLASVDISKEENQESDITDDVTRDIESDIICDKKCDIKSDITCEITSDNNDDITSYNAGDISVDSTCDSTIDINNFVSGDIKENNENQLQKDKIHDELIEIKKVSEKVDEVGSIDREYAMKVIEDYISIYINEFNKKSLMPRQIRPKYIDNHKRITIYFRNDNIKKMELFKRETGMDQSSIVNMSLDIFFKMLEEKKLF